MGWTAPQRFVHLWKSILAMHLQSFLNEHFGFLFQKFYFSDISIIWFELKGWCAVRCGVSYCYEESSLSTSEAFAMVNYMLLCIALMKSERWTIRVFSSGCHQPCLNLCGMHGLRTCPGLYLYHKAISHPEQPFVNLSRRSTHILKPLTVLMHVILISLMEVIFSSQRSRTVCLNLTGGARI